MIDKAMQILALFFVITTLILGVMVWYYHSDRDAKEEMLKQAETKNEIQARTHKVDMIEKDFNLINTKEKGKHDEEIRYDVGFHTTIFD